MKRLGTQTELRNLSSVEHLNQTSASMPNLFSTQLNWKLDVNSLRYVKAL